MTPTQVQTVLDYIYHVEKDTGEVSGLWSNARMTAQQLQTIGERISQIDITVEQAQRVLQEQWATTRKGPYSNTPDPNSLLAALRNVAYAEKKTEIQTKRGNKLIDWYRREFNIPSHVSDIDGAVHVSRSVIGKWGEDGARRHLREILREFMQDDVQVWTIVFQHYPHAEMQKQVREMIKRQRDRVAEMDKRRATVNKDDNTT